MILTLRLWLNRSASTVSTYQLPRPSRAARVARMTSSATHRQKLGFKGR